MTFKPAGGALAALLLATPALAQETGSPTAGGELASKLCSTCHIVGTEQVGSDVAPPFPVLAEDPGMTLTELHGWSGPMHPVLPNLALSPEQIADINAYLDSLGAGAGQPPGRPRPRPGTRRRPSRTPRRSASASRSRWRRSNAAGH